MYKLESSSKAAEAMGFAIAFYVQFILKISMEALDGFEDISNIVQVGKEEETLPKSNPKT
jgi:hypothetical protein